MPESAQEWFDRVSGRLEAEGHRVSEMTTWPSWPFDGELTPRALAGPTEERARGGAGGVDCFMCEAAAGHGGDYLVWTDDVLMLGVPQDLIAIPLTAFLMPCAHHDLADLPADQARRMGELMVAAERAAMDVFDVPRIQVVRYGDGQEHLHWWLMGRPTGVAQLRGTSLPLWDEILPPRTREELRDDLLLMAERFTELVGGRVLRPADGS